MILIYLILNVILFDICFICVNCVCSADLKQVYEFSEKKYQTVNHLKYELINEGFVVENGEPGAALFGDLLLSNDTVYLFKKSSILLNAVQTYSQLQLSCTSKPTISNQEQIAIISSNSEKIPLNDRCRLFTQTCTGTEKYRSFDGYCNNLLNPGIGSIFAPFTRLTPAVYDDGIHSIRKNSVTNEELTSTMRLIDYLNPVAPTNYSIELSNYGGLTFGQFVTHDTGFRNLIQNDKGGLSIRCCSADYSKELPTNLMNVGCYPIKIPSYNTYFSQFNMTCMNFVRSQPVFSNNCKLGTAELANTVSHFMDSSNLYGSDITTDNNLRSFVSGKLKVNAENILPLDETNSGNFYLTGDLRSNQHPTIALINSLFLRLHNNIAESFTKLNTRWNDEKIFQETRRIVIAIYQSITFTEWAPLYLGKTYSQQQNILCKKGGTYCGKYDPHLEAGTLNSFAQGVFRLFHKYIPDKIHLYAKNMSIYQTYNLSEVIGQPQFLQDSFDGFFYGMLYQPIDISGKHDYTQFQLFNNNNTLGVGLSLFAHDIQRSRDHGVAPYYVYQELCSPNSSKVNDWADLEVNIAPKDIERLKEVYDSYADIDVYVGLALEKTVNGYLGSVGRCLTAKQFSRTKHSDRFFYSFADSPYPFTKRQLRTIDRYNFANMICDTTQADFVPKDAFVVPSRTNRLVKCSKIASFNLSYWKK